jgi:hypothetical protein
VAVASREELLASLTSIQLGVEDGSLTQLSVGAVERQCVSLMQVSRGLMCTRPSSRADVHSMLCAHA